MISVKEENTKNEVKERLLSLKKFCSQLLISDVMIL